MVFYYNSELIRPLAGKNVRLFIDTGTELFMVAGVLTVPVLEDDTLPGHVWLEREGKQTVVLTKDLIGAEEI